VSGRAHVDLVLGILDHQLLDRNGVNCGKIDDLEISGLAEGRPEVTAILVGPGAWRARGVAGRLAAALAPRRMIRVPWDRVDAVTSVVTLNATAAELGLNRGDARASRLVRWIPGA
jgi:hypothetical protein